MSPSGMRCVEVRSSPIFKTTPVRLRDRCRYVTAVTALPPPLTKREFFQSDWLLQSVYWICNGTTELRVLGSPEISGGFFEKIA